MKKRFRKLTALLLTLALVCSLLPGTVLGADQAVNTSLPAASKDKTLRILAVGNSYSVDSLQYLYQMGKSAGYELVIGNLYHAAQDLAGQWDCWQGGKSEYTYYKISAKTDGAWSSKRQTTLQYGVRDEPWDIITLQQASGLSGVSTSYYSNRWDCVGVGKSTSLPEQAKTSVLSAVKELTQVTTQPEAQTPQRTEEVEPVQTEDAQTADVQAAEDAAEPVGRADRGHSRSVGRGHVSRTCRQRDLQRGRLRVQLFHGTGRTNRGNRANGTDRPGGAVSKAE